MTLFLIFASVLVLITLAVLIASVWRESPQSDDEPGLVAKNIAIARESLAALDTAHAGGSISESEYAEERARIELTLASELDPDVTVRRSRAADIGLIAVILVAVPVVAAWLYTQIGTPAAIDPSLNVAGSATDRDMPSMPELIAGLEQRLAETPDDVTGWRMLGRTHLATSEFDKAGDALSRALELEPQHVDTMASLAEARAMSAGGQLTGEALSLLEQAYALDARHEQTLWLLGVARQQAGRHVEALTLLGTLRAIASAGGNTEAVATIDQYAARSQAELGQPSGATSESASESASGTTSGADTDTNQPAPSADPGAPGVSLTVTVSLSDAATEELAPDTPVFVFARAANGPPMPLAVQRLTVADLPVTITLDETMAMIPNMTLAAFPEVIVGARASLSGQPTAASGDWSLELPVTIGKDASEDSPLLLEISSQIP